MAKATNNKTYINAELSWANLQLESWKSYVDSHPLHKMKDRISNKTTANGGTIPIVVATIEAQGKFIQETMKNYLTLLEVVNNLREREEAKKEARGTSEVPPRMQ